MSNQLLSKFGEVLKLAISKAFSKSNLQKIGDDTTDDLVKRVRDGQGSDNGRKTSLKSLAQNYVNARKRSRALSSKTSASKSNLTFTGQMLDSIDATVKGTNIIIEPSNTRADQKAAFVSKERPFLNLTKEEEAKLVKDLTRELDISIQKIFK